MDLITTEILEFSVVTVVEIVESAVTFKEANADVGQVVRLRTRW